MGFGVDSVRMASDSAVDSVDENRASRELRISNRCLSAIRQLENSVPPCCSASDDRRLVCDVGKVESKLLHIR